MKLKDNTPRDNKEGSITLTLNNKESGGAERLIVDAYYKMMKLPDENKMAYYQVVYSLGFEEVCVEKEFYKADYLSTRADLNELVYKEMQEFMESKHKAFLKFVDDYLKENPYNFLNESMYSFTVYKRLLTNYKNLQAPKITVIFKDDGKEEPYDVYMSLPDSHNIHYITSASVNRGFEDEAITYAIATAMTINDWSFLD